MRVERGRCFPDLMKEMLDVTRARTVSWPSNRYGWLSDHPGVAMEVLTSPAT